MILAALVFIRKVTATTTVTRVTEEYLREGHAHVLQNKEIPVTSPSSASTGRFFLAPQTRSKKLRRDSGICRRSLSCGFAT
jgi:hypothetical protein